METSSSIRSRPPAPSGSAPGAPAANTTFEYDPHDWRSHFFDIEGSILPRILLRMTIFIVWTAAVVLFHELVRPIAISDRILSVAGIAISLFLVFRTNSAYDRYWEGRKQWGAIVNETRNLARMAEALLPRDRSRAARIVRWAAVFPFAVKEMLRGARGAGGPTAKLPEAELAAVLLSGHIPLAIARRISGELAAARADGHLSDITQVELDRVVLLLIGYMGACERILRTPLPFGYVVHLRRAVVFYLGLLPFELLEAYGWGTLGIVTLLSFILLGIEEIGVEIENPFGTSVSDLPLDRICAVIERDLAEVAAAIEERAHD